MMRLGLWLAFQWAQQVRAWLNLAGFGPRNQGLGLGLGLRFHPHKKLIFARTGFINGAGYFDRLFQPSG